MKFELISCDLPFGFSDKLTMSEVDRGAASQYKVMTNDDMLNLNIPSIAAENAVLSFWVPSSLLEFGLSVMKKWGFRQTQTLIWVKTKKDLLGSIKNLDPIQPNMDELLCFGMGRVFRQTHELVLIGIKGKPYSTVANKSQRSVLFGGNERHSQKPEMLQDRLEKIFPTANKIELFARRHRKGWVCLGNQAPLTDKEDMIVSLDKTTRLTSELFQILIQAESIDATMQESWKTI